MPGKPGRSGRPRKEESPEDISNPEHSEHQQSLNRGRPRKSESLVPQSNDDALFTATEETDYAASNQVDKTSVKLRPKTDRSSQIEALIGTSVDSLPVSKLPTKRVVLQRWRSLRAESDRTNSNVSNKEIASQLTTELMHIWELARVPAMRKDAVLLKVTKLIDEFKSLLKHGSRLQIDSGLGLKFKDSIEHRLDIGISDMEEKIATRFNTATWLEDLKFYKNQLLVPQVGAMVGIDKRTSELEERRRKREEEEATRLNEEATQHIEMLVTMAYTVETFSLVNIIIYSREC